MKKIAYGIYEALIDEFLHDTLARHPELRTGVQGTPHLIDAKHIRCRQRSFLLE